jgi:tetratricopeptide (TPR) repeat protein
MTRNFFGTHRMLLIALLLSASALSAAGQAQQQASQQPTYTVPEYNGFQACRTETNAQSKVKCLDDFVTKFPNSTLMQYVYQLYYTAYYELKNYAKSIEYADRLIALGDKVDAATRLQAIQTRVQLFPFVYNPKAPDAHDQLTKERDAAIQGRDLLQSFPKPKDSTDADFDAKKKPGLALFSSSAGFADLQLKDNGAAADAFKASLADNPTDAVSAYRLGLAYLQMVPPKSLDGFWALARAINLKVPDSDKIKDYLLKQILAYEQPGCDATATAQLNELLQLAGTTGDRPATYTIPTADDLNKVRQSSNILTVLTDLKTGGDKAKLTWLAICGAEFPEVVGKIIDVTPGTDTVELHAYTGATPEEMQAATTANMDVKLQGQPEASRLQKDDGVRFSGTLVSYDPDPAFMLHWEKAKVNPDDIPEEKGKHAPHKTPAKN